MSNDSGKPVGRRIVLGIVGLGALGVVFGRQASEGVSDVVANTAPALNEVLPATGGFRYYTVTLGYPEFSPSEYRLKVGGLVENELSLSLADLAALPQTQLTKDFQCVTGWRVEDVPWTGVKIQDIMAAVGASPATKSVWFASFDGKYTESLPIDAVNATDVLIATHLYGKPLDEKAGAPVRSIIPEMYAYKGTKWLSEIRFLDKRQLGYWEERGYDDLAWVGKSNGRSDDPVT